MRLGLLIVALLGTLWTSALPGQQWSSRLNGAPLTQLAPRDTAAIVLFFVATDCPISNRTFPEMKRLREEFSGRGVRFWFVYPNMYEKLGDVESHQKEFDAGGEAIEDPSGALVRLGHAVATPQMAVLTPAGDGWRTIYSGSVDNRYVHIGLERPAATEHFGEEALSAVLAGRPVKQTTNAPVGCAIMNPGVR